MRGWRWIVEDNDYEVYRSWAADRKYHINDGEGLMHENHCNAHIRDSRITGNRGNAYLSLYKTGGIDGLLIEGNDISVDHGMAIFVDADHDGNRRGHCRVGSPPAVLLPGTHLSTTSVGESNHAKGFGQLPAWPLHSGDVRPSNEHPTIDSEPRCPPATPVCDRRTPQQWPRLHRPSGLHHTDQTYCLGPLFIVSYTQITCSGIGIF